MKYVFVSLLNELNKVIYKEGCFGFKGIKDPCDDSFHFILKHFEKLSRKKDIQKN